MEIKNVQSKKGLIVVGVIAVAFFFGLVLNQSIENSTSQENYSKKITKTYQLVAEVKNILQNAANNLNPHNADQQNFLQFLDASKEILANENKKLSALEVPEKNSDAHKKIIDCMKIEYNLMNRLRENFSIQNEYEAADNFQKSKELFTNLKEQSSFFIFEGNDFEETFDLSAVSEKLEKYFDAKKQLRYDKDQREQAEREKAAAAERERVEREKALAERQKNFHKTSLMTAEEFKNFYNKNASVLPQNSQIKIIDFQVKSADDGLGYQFTTNYKVGFVAFTENNSDKISKIMIGKEQSGESSLENYLNIMSLATHTFCNENFISTPDDITECTKVIQNLIKNALDSPSGDAETFYKGKKLTFINVTDRRSNISSLLISQ